MPQFAANLSMLYPELDFLDRFEAAAKDGFRGVEYLFPYAYEKHELAARLKANGLQQVLFNGPLETGTRATRASPASPVVKPNSAKALPKRWTTPARWPVPASTSWPASCPPACPAKPPA
jgi:hydroxypyruvate isomerase